MSDNNLLNEQTVRKFMKLAAIEPLTPGFVLRLQVSQDDELEMGAAEDEDMGAMDMSDEMPMADAGEEMADDEDDMDENALFMEKIYEKVLARLQEEK